MEKVLRTATVDGVSYGFSEAQYVEWTNDATVSNMNNFKTPGIYEIYGERTKHDDNLPINNVGGASASGNGGHSFYARLTVLASSLKPTDGSTPTEICVTQFLMLSNRKGGDGNMYYRTYNQNNSFEDGWSVWQKMTGCQEGYVFTNTKKLNQDNGIQTVNVGLNYMVDNGTYSGVYVNEDALLINGDLDSNGNGWGSFNTNIQAIQFIETFNITTINDYAVAGQVNNMLDQMNMGAYKKERQICQFKMATDLFSGTTSFKKRVYKGNNANYGDTANWSDWEEISGGGETVVDMEPLLDTLSNVLSQQVGSSVVAGLPEVYAYALDKVQSNTIYELNIGSGEYEFPMLDNNNKIKSHFHPKWEGPGKAGRCKIRIKYIDDFGSGFGSNSDACWKIDVTGTYRDDNGAKAPLHYTYYMDKSCTYVRATNDLIDLDDPASPSTVSVEDDNLIFE